VEACTDTRVALYVVVVYKMAEREGFEPSMGFKAHTPLAGEPLQPLGHLSGGLTEFCWRIAMIMGLDDLVNLNLPLVQYFQPILCQFFDKSLPDAHPHLWAH
jgi:hypothetical protein